MTLSTGEPDANSRGWIPTSPDQIRHHRFGELGFVRRGYKAEEVDAYLAKLAREVDNWAAGYSQLRAEVNRLRNWYREHDVDIDAAHRRQITAEAANVLVNAQRQADQIIADAHSQARHVQSDARTHGQAVLEQARTEAEQAAHAYRARSGPAYSPEREELERWAVWGRSMLAAINAAKTQLKATGDAFAFELGKLSPLSDAPSGGAAPGGALSGDAPSGGAAPGSGLPDAATTATGTAAVSRPVGYEQLKRPWE
jgi:DivIVA domain-containing protein